MRLGESLEGIGQACDLEVRLISTFDNWVMFKGL